MLKLPSFNTTKEDPKPYTLHISAKEKPEAPKPRSPSRPSRRAKERGRVGDVVPNLADHSWVKKEWKQETTILLGPTWGENCC